MAIFGLISGDKSEPWHCNKLKCRYEQRNFIASNESQVEYRNFQSEEKIPFHYNHVNHNSNRYCLHLVSSDELDKTDFDKMSDCTIIDLSGNRIKSIERSFFVNLPLLEWIDLSNNELTHLPENVFDDLISLRKLSIKCNLLEFLPNDLLRFNIHLEAVDFSHNKLKIISSSIFDHSVKLRKASFVGNVCITVSYPRIKLGDLKSEIAEKCSEMELLLTVIKLLKLKQAMRYLNDSNFTVIDRSSTILPTIQEDLIANSSDADFDLTTPKAEDKFDDLMTGLFWLIIPIILILFLILITIVFAVYNKYFKYSIRYPRSQ